MENKLIYLHVSAEKPRQYNWDCEPRFYAKIDIRVAMLSDEGTVCSFYYDDTFKDSQYYQNLKLTGSVSSEAVLLERFYSIFRLVYDTNYVAEICPNDCQRMAKTMNRIQSKLDKASYGEDKTSLDCIKEFGEAIKCSKIYIDGDTFDFPQGMPEIKSFILKTMTACYEKSGSSLQVLRFTNAAPELDLPSTISLEPILFNVRPVIIETCYLQEQTLAYEYKENYCLSEVQIRDRKAIDVPHILSINRRRENRVQERLAKFYSQHSVTNESGWRTYNKTFIRRISITQKFDSGSYQDYFTIYVEFQDFHSEDAEITQVWTDKSSIKIE
jgi:hypothetical protein